MLVATNKFDRYLGTSRNVVDPTATTPGGIVYYDDPGIALITCYRVGEQKYKIVSYNDNLMMYTYLVAQWYPAFGGYVPISAMMWNYQSTANLQTNGVWVIAESGFQDAATVTPTLYSWDHTVQANFWEVGVVTDDSGESCYCGFSVPGCLRRGGDW